MLESDVESSKGRKPGDAGAKKVKITTTKNLSWIFEGAVVYQTRHEYWIYITSTLHSRVSSEQGKSFREKFTFFANFVRSELSDQRSPKVLFFSQFYCCSYNTFCKKFAKHERKNSHFFAKNVDSVEIRCFYNCLNELELFNAKH